MIISLNFLKNSFENYNYYKEKSKIEKFTYSKKSVEEGIALAFYTIFLFIAFLFFFLEVFLLYFSVMIALKCSKSREEKIVNIILAMFFTMPYALLNILFNPCAKGYLESGMKVE